MTNIIKILFFHDDIFSVKMLNTKKMIAKIFCAIHDRIMSLTNIVICGYMYINN